MAVAATTDTIRVFLCVGASVTAMLPGMSRGGLWLSRYHEDSELKWGIIAQEVLSLPQMRDWDWCGVGRAGRKTQRRQMIAQNRNADATGFTMQCEKRRRNVEARGCIRSEISRPPGMPSHVADAVQPWRRVRHSTARTEPPHCIQHHTTPDIRHSRHGIATMGALLSIPMLALPSVGTVSTASCCRRRIANVRSSGVLPPRAVEQPPAAPSLGPAVESVGTASQPESHTPSFSSSTRLSRGSCSPTGP